jgi:hypothetical protein
MVARVLLFVVLAGVALGAGCEKTDHDNIEKWTHTKKGPDKLKKALSDESIDADLSAHAAANMIKTGADPDVRAALETMSPPRRAAVVAKLAPRLWDIARIEKEADLPGAAQITAKDALISLRKYADEAEKQQIDTYLIDWYAVESYEGRAQVGATLGAAVMRMVGPAGAKKLMGVANHVIVAPGQDKVKNRIGDELMLAMAATGSPDAVKYVIDIAKMDRGDKTLAVRAMNQLYKAYVDPGGLFDMNEPTGLVPNLDALVSFAKDENMPGQAVNDSIELIRATGSAHCFEPLIGMITYPHREPRFRYATAYAALLCGGTKSILQVARGLPDSGTYAKDDLVGGVAGVIAKMTPRDQVLAQTRELLSDQGRVAKWVAIEALAAMKSTEDVSKIAALGGNSERLVGFWGDQSDKDPKDRKADPTLGQRAKELADKLGKSEAPK